MPSIPPVKICLPHAVQNNPDGLSLQGLTQSCSSTSNFSNLKLCTFRGFALHTQVLLPTTAQSSTITHGLNIAYQNLGFPLRQKEEILNTA
jgi:hypothetical protein